MLHPETYCMGKLMAASTCWPARWPLTAGVIACRPLPPDGQVNSLVGALQLTCKSFQSPVTPLLMSWHPQVSG